MSVSACQFCLRSFANGGAVRMHQSKSPACKKERDANLEILMAQAMLSHSIPDSDELSDDENDPSAAQGVAGTPDLDMVGEGRDDTEVMEPPTAEEGPAAVWPRATIEEVVDEDFLFVEEFPEEGQAGATFGKGPTTFQSIRDDQVLRGAEVLGPFESDDEWELAKWLIKNVGHNHMEAFLKLPIIQGVGTAYSTKDQLLEAIDDLPGGVGWKLEKVTLTGDLEDEDGKLIVETLELWYRDPVDCIRELIGNPVFRDVMQYAPQKVFEDAAGKSEVINEMWTAAWWWKLQKLLPPGATIAPIILSSDKTKLSNFRGDQSAWPVYLMIGNISKDIRRQTSSHATILVGYLPIGKFSGYSDKARQAVRYRTFHHCMTIITRSLVAAGTEGVDMTCSDGFVRWVWPILAAYVADYPEQCLIANCMENRCPICKVKPTSRGAHEPSASRDQAETLELLKEHQSGYKNPATAAKSKADYDEFGLRPVYAPFWAQLPHSNIFQAFTPDLLHQLHKGVFKDHLVKWCTKIVGEKEVDARFRSMPSHPEVRHFKNGISSVSQWTGSEFKAMEKLFISVLVGAAPERAVGAARAVLDFIQFSSLQSHTTATLLGLANSLNNFHLYKDIFIELEARFPEHFNIPKIHSMEHYVELIRLFGSADGYNTESPERLHIDYAKNAYRASNKRDYIIQMTSWLRRQEAPGETVSCVPITPAGDAADAAEGGVVVTSPSTSSAKTYRIAKDHPSALTNIPAADIIAGHGAGYFLEAIKAYISPFSTLIPQPFDRFNLYKRLTLTLPAIPEASNNKRQNVVRATPPVPARGVRSAAQPAHLDFALVRTGEENNKTDGTALHGLRVAHVKVLFQLPAVYGLHTAQPLAYVEWYTPFGVPDPVTGLFTIRRSTRNNHVYGEIVGVDRIEVTTQGENTLPGCNVEN
ncbi:Zn-finger domain-containing protein [Mycena leptocephala]|nr:Zn-finger domain-containing protein [Mycena leptocephala]